MDMPLAKLGIQSGTQFDCDDFVQCLQFKLIAFHSAELEPEQFDIISSSEDMKTETKKAGADSADTVVTKMNGKTTNGFSTTATVDEKQQNGEAMDHEDVPNVNGNCLFLL